MNVEIGTEAAQFPEKEYINGIFIAVQCRIKNRTSEPKLAINTGKLLFLSLLVNKKSAKKKKREKRRKLFRSVSYLDQQGIHQGELRKVPGHVVFVLPILRSGYVDYLLLTVLWLRSNIYTVTSEGRQMKHALLNKEQKK